MIVYWLLLCVIACERVAELVVSGRHAKHLLARGGGESGRGHFPVMIVLHVALIAGCVLEPRIGCETRALAAAAPSGTVAALSETTA
jgi:methyltransferase